MQLYLKVCCAFLKCCSYQLTRKQRICQPATPLYWKCSGLYKMQLFLQGRIYLQQISKLTDFCLLLILLLFPLSSYLNTSSSGQRILKKKTTTYNLKDDSGKQEWMSSDKNIHEPETSCCTGCVRTRKRCVAILLSIWIVLAKCNSGEILDQKICKAEEEMLLASEEPCFLLKPS